MYPHSELNRLAAHKATLQRHIADRRRQCIEAATEVAKPLVWLDRMVAYGRRFAPLLRFVAVPLSLFAARAVFSRIKLLRFLVHLF